MHLLAVSVRSDKERYFPQDEVTLTIETEDTNEVEYLVAVVDKAVSLGNEGPLFTEVKAVSPVKRINGFIMGLGGRSITEEDIEFVIKNAGVEKNFWVSLNE